MKERVSYPELKVLLHQLDESYTKKAWHGPNLRGSIRGLTCEQAAWRPGRSRHNIWEIVVHTAYWKYAVRRRLLGEKRGSFPIKGSNWFARPQKMTAEAWRQDVSLLEATHRSLHAAILRLRPSDLHKASVGGKSTPAVLISGIASHDVYHAGQIQLIKRLQRR